MDCLLQKSREKYLKTIHKVKQYPSACKQHSHELANYTLDKQDCDFSNHVYPGFHINKFREQILNKEVCLGDYIYPE